jgi:protein-disulfide isomerase
MEDQELSKRDRKRKNKEEKKSSEDKSSMQNKLMVVGAIVAVAVGAFWLMYRGGGSEEDTTDTPQVTSPDEVTTEDHVKGAENAIVTIVEYGDFQCPACGSYQPIVKQLADEFSEDLRVVFRHFPLNSIHRHAQIASQAAEAAADQGYFWEMHDILFERQEDWSNVRDPRSLFVEYADELTMNTEQFEAYMNSDAARDTVKANYDGGFAAGIDSTPTFYINGDKVSNPQGLEPFRALVQQIIDSEKSKEESMEESTDSAETEEAPVEDITPSL